MDSAGDGLNIRGHGSLGFLVRHQQTDASTEGGRKASQRRRSEGAEIRFVATALSKENLAGILLVTSC